MNTATVTAPIRPTARFMRGHLAHWVALGFGSGLSRWAPGTVGTLWAWAAFVVADQWLTTAQWGWVIAAYAVAKVVEVGDHAIFEATGGWLSGHTLKHLVAACAAWPVIAALRPMQNGTSEPAPSRPALHTRRV